ncbi:hypothetical protein [Mycobacterium botniense]|uniref:Uncharacterized protein n=1 Tax=Mycobacterium botniense TaxID=84962 RepID=A0A7I9XRZ5_9MYCO|nr:hypothetical protein [Mycobacterium botniense]GFG72714.1 hypothetical protein MBOT_00790 [Mycobacterium botniense]
MPRIRSLKPEFFRSPDTASVDFPVRIFYQALWCWADDRGIGETNLNGLLGFAFADEDGFSAQDLRRFCADCARAFGVVFYTVRGRHYYAIPSWEKHQKLERRSERFKHPAPDDPDAVPDQRIYSCADSAPICADSAPDTPRKIGAGTGEQGNRGTGEDDDDSPTEVTHQSADPAAANVVVVETGTRPPKRHPSAAAKTVVRQTLGHAGYPRRTIERLAVQVEQLARDGHPDTVIRQALTAWDTRPDCTRPEYLATVLSDVIKASRASPAVNGHRLQGADLRAAENEALKHQLRQRQQRELP